MLKIYYRNTTPVCIRPTPLISISHVPNKNKVGTMGCTYSINLNGTIIAHQGSPIVTPSGIYSDDILPFVVTAAANAQIPEYNLDLGDRLTSILRKQNTIRKLFSQDGQPIEIKSLDESKTAIWFYPSVVSINFEEGPYIETCKYSISLEAPLLFDSNGNVFTEGLIGSTFSPAKFNLQRSKDYYLRETANYNTTSLQNILDRWGGLVEDFTDTWSLETDESNAQSIELTNIPISYRVTRNASATGKVIHHPTINKKPWEHALGFLKKTILEEPSAPPGGGGYGYDQSKLEQYPGFRLTDNRNTGKYASDFLDLPSYYRGYNHVRSFNIDKTAGSCSITDTWLLASGQSHLENYTIAIDSSVDAPFRSVKIDGTIKGLSELHASGYVPSELNNSANFAKIPYNKAIKHYFDISNNGKFGIGSILYRRANNFASDYLEYQYSPNVLNSQPLSISLGTNELSGEITYSLEFNDRPYNLIPGVLAENISVNDTYPGDVFATIPVIGRKTGPILQYLKGRTEYNRSVNIELLLDYTDIPYSGSRNILLYKPILNKTNQNLQGAIRNLINQLSPIGEPYVTDCFLSAPTETWAPKEGRYSLNLNWIYKKSR